MSDFSRFISLFSLPDSHELLLIQPNWTWAGLSFLKRRYASSSFFHLYFCVYSSKTNSSTGVVTNRPISTMNLLQSRELLQWTMVFCSWFRQQLIKFHNSPTTTDNFTDTATTSLLGTATLIYWRSQINVSVCKIYLHSMAPVAIGSSPFPIVQFHPH